MLSESVNNLINSGVKVKKIYVVEKDDNVLGYFLTQPESVEYLRSVVTHEYVSLLPTNKLRVVEETDNGSLIVEIYAILRDTVMCVERLHTRIVSKETYAV